MMSQKNPAQRVGVFVDVANMYHSAQKLHGTNVDFAQVLKTAVADRQLVRAVAYAIKAETSEEEKFFTALEQQGYETRIKELQTFIGGHKKGDWDLGLAIDAIRMAPKLDAVVLVSGDGDYIPLVEHLKSLGARVEVIAFRESCSTKLVEAADDFTNLSAEKQRFLKRSNRARQNYQQRTTTPQRAAQPSREANGGFFRSISRTFGNK